MKRLLTAVVLSSVVLLGASDPRNAIVGTWTGSSICTNVRPACHDEIALYRATPGDAANVVNMSMAKVVDGKEVVMGVSPFRVDFDHRVMTWEFERNGLRGLWTLSWSGAQMAGTLKQLPGGEVIRNIRVTKQ